MNAEDSACIVCENTDRPLDFQQICAACAPDAKCECGGTKRWCSVCRVWSATCHVEYGTCQCS